jgi:hypothetical protein
MNRSRFQCGKKLTGNVSRARAVNPLAVLRGNDDLGLRG